MEGASRADHEPHPFELRPESLPRLQPPRDAGVSAVPAGARGAGRGALAGRGAKPGARRDLSARLVPGWSLAAAQCPQGQLQAAGTGTWHPASGMLSPVSRFQPRRTEPGSRVRKNPDPI